MTVGVFLLSTRIWNTERSVSSEAVIIGTGQRFFFHKGRAAEGSFTGEQVLGGLMKYLRSQDRGQSPPFVTTSPLHPTERACGGGRDPNQSTLWRNIVCYLF